MTHFIRLITTQHDNTAIANFAAAVATNTDTNLYESDDKYSYMDLAEYNTPEGNVVEIMLSEELSDDQLDKIVEQITLEDYEIQASLDEGWPKLVYKGGKALYNKIDKIANKNKVTVHAGPEYKGVDITDAQTRHWLAKGEKLSLNPRGLTSNEPHKATLDSAQPTIRHFKDRFSAGKSVDEILVTPKKDGGYTVIDGNHRLAGALAAGAKKVNVRIIPRKAVKYKYKAPPQDQQVQHVYPEHAVKEEKITEAVNEKLVVIYPGRFHPFHKGHAGVFELLKQRAKSNYYGGAGKNAPSSISIFIATSDKQELGKSPFTFEEKLEMIKLTGISPDSVVCCQVPYQATDITDHYDMNNTVVLYAVSEKDMAEDPRFNFPPKGTPSLRKDDQPAHMQRWDKWDNAEPLAKHSYVDTVPTNEFNVMGEPMMSATEIRQRFPNLSSDQQKTFINDLFGNYSDNVLNIMRNKLGDNNEHE